MASLLEQVLIALLPMIVISAAAAIYLNRQRLNALFQRLFGLDTDNSDDGYLPRLDDKIDILDDKMDELNHQRINALESQVSNVEDRLDRIHERLAVEEEADYVEEAEDFGDGGDRGDET